jgi:hypothetical protein
MKQIRKILYNAWTMAALSMLAAVVGVLTSCEEHSDIYDDTLKVGNIYLSNDRVVSPEGYNPDTDDAVGVIFYVHEDTALVVGKQEMGSFIYSDSLGTIPNVVNDAVSLSGMQNTAAIRASEFAKHFPALRALEANTSKVTGWSLPSAGDLRALSVTLGMVSRSMALISSDDFSREQYFSTSQDGTTSSTEQENYFTVSLSTGSVTSTFKGEKSRLRLMLTITK